MKKIFMLFIVFAMILSLTMTYTFAADVNTTVGWQDTNTAGLVVSWDVFRGTSATGPWTFIKNQAYYALTGGATEYQTTFLVTVPNNALTTVYFKAQTVGTGGLRSVDSNVANKVYDTRVAPSAPEQFNVK
jgi:hypothetical protein